MTDPALPDPMVDYRLSALEAVFRRQAEGARSTLPPCNEALDVERVDFLALPAGPQPERLEGALVTPWSILLVRLPLVREDAAWRVGEARWLTLGHERFEFVAAHDAMLGTFDVHTLFSPLHDFASQALAVAAARAVLERARRAPPAVEDGTGLSSPSRRGFLFGRRG
ncbi:[NiFe]-hydrogenase assembly chaperone HybE [Methyloversatilis thermotolerans]|uniref:[NiFe]-hydrogenase assembly chaperone HybE n=1 Tax=Methyloversatilis thermotolerans TaxID=1346290 RepID=UPI00035DB17E|nr:[NiFe]-hydrogenase assembly chaperone HybE [Methyloversatilis thermotolerans]